LQKSISYLKNICVYLCLSVLHLPFICGQSINQRFMQFKSNKENRRLKPLLYGRLRPSRLKNESDKKGEFGIANYQ